MEMDEGVSQRIFQHDDPDFELKLLRHFRGPLQDPAALLVELLAWSTPQRLRNGLPLKRVGSEGRSCRNQLLAPLADDLHHLVPDGETRHGKREYVKEYG